MWTDATARYSMPFQHVGSSYQSIFKDQAFHCECLFVDSSRHEPPRPASPYIDVQPSLKKIFKYFTVPNNRSSVITILCLRSPVIVHQFYNIIYKKFYYKSHFDLNAPSLGAPVALAKSFDFMAMRN